MRPGPWLAALGCALCMVLPAAAQPAEASPSTAEPAAAAASLTPDDAGLWLDGLMPGALARGDIAGAVITVVKDGEILVSRGYGLADVAQRRPVDPETTLFRVASVSKLLTWTAVMQLVEAGQLDLDADINGYLDFSVPGRGAPITLRHLMTHTAGFEANIKQMWTSESAAQADGLALGPYLARWVPHRIFAPGTMPAYSNYGTSLAGYIVERVSGLPFATYVERRIFAPLQMRHASFEQPLPPALRALVSQGYGRGSGPPRAFEVTPSAPAGGMSASGSDMGRFMIAHLAAAAGQDTAILKAATSARMLTPQTRFAPPLQTMALGFYELDVNGERIVAHAGDTFSFHSQLLLFRDRNVGLFVSFNSAGVDGITGPLRREILERFADRYFPDARPTPSPAFDAELALAQARQLAAAAYRDSRRTETGLGRVGVLSQTRLEALEDGGLRLARMKQINGQPTTFHPIGPWLWQASTSEVRLAALIEEGRPIGFAVDSSAPFNVFLRVEAYRSAVWLKPLLSIAVIVLGLAAVSWPIAAIVRRRYGRTLAWTPSALRAYRLSRLASAWLLLVPATALAVMSWGAADFARFDARLDPVVIGLGIATVVAIVAGIGSTAWHLQQTVRSRRGMLAVFGAALLLVSACVLAYVLVLMGLADFALDY
ncbi:serine hydrolase domain-containing protein [Luteimonas sp. RC10]|uniref:serine hydrolase domain-containing protein n=1 Tax=Luteimonas sp. RC10 TaxID=2587035 RepID=UPI00161639B5|nr:serine hydrolase domain-containing protein [Luteimonas sp. RC10]MBB3344545.1 CubicO group peptidase (beta-lactamase class C family) [Luteimonas sp. RC10]